MHDLCLIMLIDKNAEKRPGLRNSKQLEPDFPGHALFLQVLDNVELSSNMTIQMILMIRNRERGKSLLIRPQDGGFSSFVTQKMFFKDLALSLFILLISQFHAKNWKK